MTTTIHCQVCKSKTFHRLADFGFIPVSGTFLNTPDSHLTLKFLAFEYCANCSLIRKRGFDDVTHDYRILKRSTSPQMPSYVPDILTRFRQLSLSHSEFILDIGGNDGSFLDLLVPPQSEMDFQAA